MGPPRTRIEYGQSRTSYVWGNDAGERSCSAEAAHERVASRVHWPDTATGSRCARRHDRAFVPAGVAGARTAATGSPSKQVDLSGVTLKVPPSGKGVPQRSAAVAGARQPLPSNYTESEYLLGGTAATYKGPAAGPVTVDTKDNPFTSRILVRAPAKPADFSGSVWIEPMNTSGGGDSDAVWGLIAPLIAQRGDAWIGVTVRSGQVPLLQTYDPVRYADLNFKSNDYGWDVLRDVGALVKTNDPKSPLHDLKVKQVYASGYSQSGVDASTLASGFNEVTRLQNGSPVFDGYLIGGRGGFMSPLQSSNTLIPNFETSKLRPLDVPTLDFEPQTNVEGAAIEVPTVILQQSGVAGSDKITTPTSTYTSSGGAYVRRPDSNTKANRFRLVEVSGSPHGSGTGAGCVGNGSTFPVSSFFEASAAHLARWAEKGTAPASVPRMELATLDKASVAKNDQYGNALGGIRSPFLDVPLAKYEAHSTGAPTCWQFGNVTPLPAATLKQSYGDAQGYMTKFTKALDAAIKKGYILPLDRQTVLSLQQGQANAAFSAS